MSQISIVSGLIGAVLCVPGLVRHGLRSFAAAMSANPTYTSIIKAPSIDPPPRILFNVWATIKATALVLTSTVVIAWTLGFAFSFALVIGTTTAVATSTIFLSSRYFGRVTDGVPGRHGFLGLPGLTSKLHRVGAALVTLTVIATIAMATSPAALVGAIPISLAAVIFITAAATYATLSFVSIIANTASHRLPMTSFATATMNDFTDSTSYGQGNSCSDRRCASTSFAIARTAAGQVTRHPVNWTQASTTAPGRSSFALA